MSAPITTPRTVEEWAIARQRALDNLDSYIAVLSGYGRLHGMTDEAIDEAIRTGQAHADAAGAT